MLWHTKYDLINSINFVCSTAWYDILHLIYFIKVSDMIATFFIKHCFGIAKISITLPIFAAIHQIKVAEKILEYVIVPINNKAISWQ